MINHPIAQGFARISVVLACLLNANLAALQWWASWGPPSPSPQSHWYLALGYSLLSFGLLLTAIAQHRNRRSGNGS